MADGDPRLAIEIADLNLWFGSFQALFEVDLRLRRGIVTALIGPSGCGKTSLLRSCNRLHDRVDGAVTRGTVRVLGRDVHAPEVSVVQLRRHVGMVFQRPNPLPLSIRDNVLFGHRLHQPPARGTPAARGGAAARREADDLVEAALREVLLWERVKDRLHHLATDLTLEEQQKLCIARLLPAKPSVLLMDEPCSALDPEATRAVEDLIWDLRGNYTIVLVTHHMAQARRTSDECVFMLHGRVVEHAATDQMFVAPQQPQTADYIEGRFG